MTGDSELVGHGRSEMSEHQARTREKLAQMLQPLIPHHRALVHDVCFFSTAPIRRS